MVTSVLLDIVSLKVTVFMNVLVTFCEGLLYSILLPGPQPLQVRNRSDDRTLMWKTTHPVSSTVGVQRSAPWFHSLCSYHYTALCLCLQILPDNYFLTLLWALNFFLSADTKSKSLPFSGEKVHQINFRKEVGRMKHEKKIVLHLPIVFI